MRKPYFKWPQVFSIYDSFQPAFHLLSWCLPITFPNSRTSTKRTSLVQILLFTLNISVLIYFYVNVANDGNEFLQMTSDSEIMMTGTKLITFFGIFYIIGINIVFKVLQKRIWTFIKRLDDLDKRIHQFGHVFNYFREFKILLFLCITTFITLIILWIYAILAIGVTNIVVRLTMSYFVLNMNATGMGIILLMPLFIFAIRERFASINWQIRNILHNQEHNQQAAIVTELARCHSQLIDLTDDVNQTLIGFITVDLVASFIFNIMNSLALFRIVYFGDTSGWILRLSNGLWGVFQGGMAAIFLITSDSLTKQVRIIL